MLRYRRLGRVASLYVVERWGEEPYVESRPWLELRGTANEPVRDVRDVVISLSPKDKMEIGPVRPAPVGSIVQMRPLVSVVLAWPQSDFDRVWAMALGGQLKHAHFCFTKPRYNTALVVTASFPNEPEE